MSRKIETVTLSRRTVGERRVDSRKDATAAPVAEKRPATERRSVRRRQIDPTTCERDYSMDELEFMQAVDEYKRVNGRMFPTCSELLEVVRKLGYCKPVVGQIAATDACGMVEQAV